MTDRIFPLPRPDDDSRFSVGLILDVRAVLTKHGYPESSDSGDLVALQQALFGFLYGTGQ